MKTKPLFLLLSLASILFFGEGCQKDQVEVSEPIQQSATKTVNLIKTFAQRLHSDLKTTDSIPVDSVIWYLGAYTNYTYGDASAKGLNLYIDSSFLSISYTGSNVSVNDIARAYNKVVDSIRGHYTCVNSTDKHLLAAVISSDAPSSGKISIKITSIIVYGPYSTQPYVFDSTDHWRWWNYDNNQGGYCGGPNQNQHPESDAAIEIQKKVMIRRGVPGPGYCFAPPYETVPIAPEDFNNPNPYGQTNYFTFLLFYNDDNLLYFHTCLAPFEMNFYLNGVEHIIYTPNNLSINSGAKPPDMSFISLQLYCALWPEQNRTVIEHLGTAFYGTVIPSGGIPEDL